MRFSPFVRTRCGHVNFFGHILHKTAQTEVYTENQWPRFNGSGLNNLGRTDGRAADTGRYREAPPLKIKGGKLKI